MSGAMKLSVYQQGMNLVELLVAMAIGLLVILAVSSVFISTRSTNRGQEAVSRVQENSRYSFEALGRAARRAGFRHVPDSYYTDPATGFPANGSVDGVSFASGQYVGGTAAKFVIRYRGASDGLSRDCTGASVAGGTLVSESWYVSGNNLVCKVNTNAAQTIIEGVENIRFEYGENTGGAADSTRGVDAYRTTPADVTDWTNVSAVRTEILLRSADNATTAAQAYTFNGTLETPSDRRLRRVYTATFNIRN